MPIRDFPLSLNARGAEIKELHGNLGKLGVAIPKNELDEQSYGVATRDAILKLQAKYRLARTGVLDEATKAILSRAVAAQTAKPHVEGRIRLGHGLPPSGLTVRLYSRGFAGAEVRLGETRTDNEGFYSLSYDPPRPGVSLHLEVRAVDAQNREMVLSGAKYNAERFEVLNLVAPARVQPLAAEFTRLVGDLTKHVGRIEQLATAREDADRRDLTLLHQASGWDARLVALASTAVKLGAETAIPQDALYALFRAGLPTDKSQLAQVSTTAVEKALAKARDAGIISLDASQLASAKTAFEKFARETRRTTKAPGALSSFSDLLEGSGLSGPEIQGFEELYFTHLGEPDELWRKARERRIPEAKVKSLQVQGKLAYLTLNNADLAMKLQGEIGASQDLGGLVELDLYKSAKWKERLVTAAGGDDPIKLNKIIPPAFAGKEAKKRLDAYAADLARKVRLAFPTRVIARMIENDELRLGPDHATVKTTVQTFLKNAEPLGFQLGRVPLGAFIATHRVALLQGIAPAQVEVTLENVKKMQRLYQITPSDEALSVALELGFASANEVAAFAMEVFLERFGRRFPSLDVARLFYRKAQQVSAVTYNVFTSAKQLDSTPPLFALSPEPARRAQAKNALIKHYPTMESLFGSLDFCECDHCRSVLSPAAYLVDLLQFLDPRGTEWSSFLDLWKDRHNGEAYTAKYKKPYDALIERRPDLPHIPLTCENTHTALPYIDLVIEILEYYVANGKLDAKAAHDTGNATTPELLAEPQNVVAAAYDKLRLARYPLTLPFDLWLETVRRFCDYFETPLWRVLEVFRPADGLFVPAQTYDRSAIFTEQLGLSSAEYALFTDPDPLPNWHALYGYMTPVEATTVATDSETGQRIDLNSAKALSRRLGVTYKELVDIVRTGFVNPKLDALVVLDKLDVAMADVLFYKEHKGLLTQNASSLSPADRQRLAELKAFEQRLEDLSQAFQASEFNAKSWVNEQLQTNAFDDILVLADLDAGCNFDETTLRYVSGQAADDIAFLKINLFVRLWRKLGWTIEETDRALQTFVPRNTPFSQAHLAKSPLKTALIYLVHLKALDERLRVGKQSRLKLLTLWSPMATTGKNPLYAQLFLTRSVLKTDAVFDDPLGRYLSKPGVLIRDHLLALQGALGLSADAIGRILMGSGSDMATGELLLHSVSLLYRHALLAKALKLSIDELIALKQLSGFDPFKPLSATPLTNLDEDHPFTQTLRFVEIAEQVKESGLKIDDLEYLLRHRFDPVGKYRPDATASALFSKTLADGIRAIRTEHTVPADPGAMGEDALPQKLGLILPADVVQRFLAMLNGIAEFTATKSGVQEVDRLDPAAFADEPAIVQVSYNATRQEQKLTFRGVLFDDQKNDLKARFPAAIVADLLDDIQIQSRAFFAKHLQKQTLGAESESGFLDAADFDLLFAPASSELSDTQLQDRLRSQRARLANTFLPFLQRQLIRQFILQTMTGQMGADTALVETLMTDARLLGDPQPLLEAFTATAGAGLNATFFASTDGSGAALAIHNFADADTALKKDDQPLKPAGANSARFEGYLEVPTPGAYRFHVVFDKKDAEAELQFDHLPAPFLKGAAASDNAEISEYLELKSGVPYRFRLDLRKLGGGDAQLLVQSETLAKDTLARLTLYPMTNFARADRAVVLLSKALQLIQGLNLNEREVRYLLTHAADFGNLSLSALPTRAGDDTPERAKALFAQFLRLAGYARLKRELAGGTDELIGVFETQAAVEVYALLAKLMRRDETTVKTVADLLFTAPSFRNELALQRLWEALQIVERLGVPANSVLGWTKIVSAAATSQERFAIARDLKETIKARFEPENWRRIAQSVFDKLRQRSRDALVAHVMHQHGFARMEQLFEYFLIDPGMEPVVQTSRIRLAISSVQLFIQRCLLNLERKVHPSAINSKHWQWMKRYRVWEANRKILLFPENWLEPEFRDDKTHLFQELESALLQGDVSNELAEDALFHYLTTLEELARLEMVAMYLEEKLNDPEGAVLHVIGRTYQLPHKYFYRRYAYRMWTPWEPVTTEIEGDHVVAAVWQGRLNLFWLTFLQKGAQDTTSGALVSETMMKPISKAVKQEVEIQLNRCEYFQGQWTNREATGFDRPIRADVANDFTNRDVFMHVSKRYDDDNEMVEVHLGLRKATASFQLTNGLSTSWLAHAVDMAAALNDFNLGTLFGHGIPKIPREIIEAPYLAGVRKAFRLVNRNSPVDVSEGDPPPPIPLLHSGDRVTQYQASGALRVSFVERIEDGKADAPVTKEILGQGGKYSLLPCSNTSQALPEDISALVSPFFYQDDKNTFFVEPTLTEKTIRDWDGWVIRPSVIAQLADDDWWKAIPLAPRVPMREPLGIDTFDPHEIDPTALFALQGQDDWLTDRETVLQFGDRVIGKNGAVDQTAATRLPGLAAAARPAVGPQVIGSAGLNPMLLANLQQRRAKPDADALASGSIDQQS